MSDNVTKTPWEEAYKDLRGISVVDGSKLVSFETKVCIGTYSFEKAVFGKEVTTFHPGFNGVILYAVANTSEAPINGSFWIRFQLNGQSVLEPLEIKTTSKYEILDFRHCKDRAFGPSDYIEVGINNTSVQNEPSMVVDIYVMKVRDII